MFEFWKSLLKKPSTSEIFSFRQIYKDILNYPLSREGGDLYGEILQPFLNSLKNEPLWPKKYLQKVEKIEQVLQFQVEESWSLYSFQRFNELLLLNFQKPLRAEFPKTNINLDLYKQIMRDLGLQVYQSQEFSPFFQQIVRVIPTSDPNEEIKLVQEIWPSLVLKNLLMSRAGVVVSGGINKINQKIAENSCLYWSH